MWRPSYENLRRVAAALSHINADLIQRHFTVSADTAQQFMERLVAEKRFGDVEADGWHYPPIRKLRRHRPPRKQIAANKPEPVGDLAGRIDDLEQECHTLQASIKRLQIAGKTVIAQREHWKARAQAAEEHLEAERNRRSKGDDRFDALRRLVAKELHPDFCKGSRLEKLMRQECFKKLWPEIERLAERR